MIETKIIIADGLLELYLGNTFLNLVLYTIVTFLIIVILWMINCKGTNIKTPSINDILSWALKKISCESSGRFKHTIIRMTTIACVCRFAVNAVDAVSSETEDMKRNTNKTTWLWAQNTDGKSSKFW